ncbi:MAG: hypothetical protein HC853_00075 [Anaerolineae bacterium]|nr:hypothetical protein [Anaerolineae bacterium]
MSRLLALKPSQLLTCIQLVAMMEAIWHTAASIASHNRTDDPGTSNVQATTPMKNVNTVRIWPYHTHGRLDERKATSKN